MMLRGLLRCVGLLAAVSVVSGVVWAQAATGSRWDKPAAELAKRIAEMLGPGPAHFSLRNLSSTSAQDASLVQRLIEDELKAAGVTAANGDAPNSVRVTLSESASGGLWVAEIVEGSRTQIVMEPVELAVRASVATKQNVTLRREVIARMSELKWKRKQDQRAMSQIVAAMEMDGGLVVLTPERVALFAKTPDGWMEQEHTDLPSHANSRDARGVLSAETEEHSIVANVPGAACSGSMAPGSASLSRWDVKCHAGDDFWPVAVSGGQTVTALYNAGRNYFSGLVAPSQGSSVPTFYTAGLLTQRAGAPALLVDGTQGQMTLVENGELKSVTGTRDWGSDLAVLNGACSGTSEVIVSSSGEGAPDSLRAYELRGVEAIASSEPLTMSGAVMAVFAAHDEKSVVAIVRTRGANGGGEDYEVDRVTATCN